MAKKRFFVQDWGTYENQTLVAVGLKYDDFDKAFKQYKSQKEMIQEFKRDEETITNSIENNRAFCWISDHGASVLWMKDWKFEVEHLKNLVHETNHLVKLLLSDKDMGSELEANAYQQEYLFGEIIKKLR